MSRKTGPIEQPEPQAAGGLSEPPADTGDGLLNWIDVAVRQLTAGLVDAPADGVGAGVREQVYERGFALGEALGRRFRARCATASGPPGLALLVSRLGEAQSSPPSLADRARRALLAGFCWDLEAALCPRHPAADATSPRSS